MVTYATSNSELRSMLALTTAWEPRACASAAIELYLSFFSSGSSGTGYQEAYGPRPPSRAEGGCQPKERNAQERNALDQ